MALNIIHTLTFFAYLWQITHHACIRTCGAANNLRLPNSKPFNMQDTMELMRLYVTPGSSSRPRLEPGALVNSLKVDFTY